MIATALDHLTAPPSSKLLGWHLLDARPKDGWVRIGFDGKREFCNPAGFVQGGILSAMLDDTMGPAVFVMTDGKLYTATITMTVNFLAPAKPGPITGEANVTQLGKTIAFVEGRLTAEDGTVLATATTSARLVEPEQTCMAQKAKCFPDTGPAAILLPTRRMQGRTSNDIADHSRNQPPPFSAISRRKSAARLGRAFGLRDGSAVEASGSDDLDIGRQRSDREPESC